MKNATEVTPVVTIETEVNGTETAPVVNAEVKGTKKEKVEKPQIIPIKGMYGLGEDRVDVTDQLVGKLNGNRKLTNKLTGIDPVKGKVKTLKLTASFEGKEREFEITENEFIRLSFDDVVNEGGGAAETVETEVAEEVTA